MKSEIGYCVGILSDKFWGKTPVDGRLRSKSWWENRLNKLINVPTYNIPKELNTTPGIYDSLGNDVKPPIPLEIEFNMPDLDYNTLLKAWRKLHPA